MDCKKISLIKFNKKLSILIFLLGISIIFAPSASGYLLPISSLELYLEHEVIVLGKVLSLMVIENESKAPRTLYEIEILQHIKDNIETNEIMVIGLGAVNSTRHLDTETILSEGQQVLLMLNEQPDGQWLISPYSSVSESLNPDLDFILPPLKLFKAGIPIEEIHCKTHLELALKSSNGAPVCIQPKSLERLFERGWIK